MQRNWSPHTLVVRVLNGATIVENKFGGSSELNIELLYNQAAPLLGIHTTELKAGTQTDTRTPMFIAALFTTAKRWKQLKCPSTDAWINKMWYVPTVEYYPALKRNEVLTQATTWMNLENTMLSERSEAQKDKYYMIPLT